MVQQSASASTTVSVSTAAATVSGPARSVTVPFREGSGNLVVPVPPASATRTSASAALLDGMPTAIDKGMRCRQGWPVSTDGHMRLGKGSGDLSCSRISLYEVATAGTRLGLENAPCTRSADDARQCARHSSLDAMDFRIRPVAASLATASLLGFNGAAKSILNLPDALPRDLRRSPPFGVP